MPQRRRTSPKQNASTRTRESTKQQAAGSEQPANLFSFTLDAATGEVVKVEKLDAAGTRRKVPDRQVKILVRKERAKLEEAIEEAFEAGINCVLGDGAQDENEASEQDVELRHVLIAPLIEQSPASRLLKRPVLDRAVLGSLVQQSNPAVPSPQA